MISGISRQATLRISASLSTALVAANGNIYAGLWYPVIVAAVTLVVGAIFIRETKGHKIQVV